MLYTLFFNRYRDDLTGERRAEYEARAQRMMELQRWRLDAEHLQAQERGRSDYYVYYRTVICEPLRERGWPEPKPE